MVVGELIAALIRSAVIVAFEFVVSEEIAESTFACTRRANQDDSFHAVIDFERVYTLQDARVRKVAEQQPNADREQEHTK